MENGRFFSNERGLASGKNSHFNSIGGNLARVSDYNSTEVSIAKTQDDLVRSTYKKKEFLPFLNERDGLNRLIAVPSKYDPTKLEESGNPAFYYKSQRFNKYLLRLEHAENNKHALGKMLDHHSRTPSETKNFLEADKVIRLKKLMTKKSINFDEWKRSGVETKANFDEGTTIQRGLNTLDSLDSAILPRTILVEDSSTNYFFKNLQEIRMNQKKKSQATSQFAGNRKASQNIKAIKLKSQAKLARNLFLPSDDYINFYKKLDSDIRDIAISSIEVRRTAKDNVAHLNSVAKKGNRMTALHTEENTWLPSSLTSPTPLFNENDLEDGYQSQRGGHKKHKSKGNQDYFAVK